MPLQQLFPPVQSPLLPQVQALLTQVSLGAQVCPHDPQLFALVWVLVQVLLQQFGVLPEQQVPLHS